MTSNHETTDQQLLVQIKNSDMEAFKHLFKQYQPILFRQVLFQVSDTDLAHDIVQQTFISVWEHRFSLKPELSFLAYIFRISRNIIYDWVKHDKVRKRFAENLPQPTKSVIDDPEELLQIKMTEIKIELIINSKLPSKCREIFLLSRFEDKTNKEIAELLNLSIRTVENQINKALKILRKHLSRIDI